MHEETLAERPALVRRPGGFFLCLLLTACSTTAVTVAPVGTVAQARQNYQASIDTCQQLRSARLSTLGPPIFQPISGDQPFNECLTRAKAHLDTELDEAD